VLVCLHGVASNHTRWSEFVAETTLRRSWDLVRPDLRGYATSPWRGRLDLGLWADDVASILGHEGYPPAVVVGHCLGASVAVGLARRHPDRVLSLILVEPVVRAALAGPLRHVARWGALVRAAIPLVRGLNALGVRRRRLPPLDLRQLDREARQAMRAAARERVPLSRYASPWEDLRTTPTAVYLQSLLAVSLGLPDLRGLRLPILALVAAGGLIAEPEPTIRALAGLEACRVVRVDASHWIPTERPAEMRRAIEAWCDELEGRRLAQAPR
jgi:pimeloyl-ACP methyl ester carboxylesterase